jgi:putative RecB family exonuclease
MRLSYSSLDTYTSCALKYKFKEIDKVKEPKSKEAVFGTLIHSALQFAHSPALVPPTLEETLDHFTRGWNADIWESEAEERAAFTQGIQMLQKYYADNDVSAANIVALESRFQFDVGPENNRHTISGIIDRIDKTDDGYEIIDYKTSKKLPSQNDVDKNMQLTIYAKAFLERYPKEKDNLANITVSLYFLKHGVKISSTRTLEELAHMEEQVLDVTRNIEEEKFEPTVTPLCDWCGFQRICPMQKHKFKDEVWDDADVRSAIDELAALKKKMTADRKKAATLQADILQFMDDKGLGRVFGDAAIAALSERKTYSYDIDAVRSTLERMGKWDDVVRVDGTALNKLLPTLPVDAQHDIEGARETKVSTTLSLKRS